MTSAVIAPAEVKQNHMNLKNEKYEFSENYDFVMNKFMYK